MTIPADVRKGPVSTLHLLLPLRSRHLPPKSRWAPRRLSLQVSLFTALQTKLTFGHKDIARTQADNYRGQQYDRF
jgi:hypothetical protein